MAHELQTGAYRPVPPQPLAGPPAWGTQRPRNALILGADPPNEKTMNHWLLVALAVLAGIAQVIRAVLGQKSSGPSA